MQRDDIVTDVEGHPTPDAKAFAELTRRPGVGVSFVIAGDPIRVGVRRAKTSLELRFPLPAQEPTDPDLRSHRRLAFPSVSTIDSLILPNQCGGPVVDEFGDVVGIAIARPYSKAETIYVISAVLARQVARDLASANANREKR